MREMDYAYCLTCHGSLSQVNFVLIDIRQEFDHGHA